MDFQQRIAEATQYRDQTRASYANAQGQTRQAQSEYDKSFSTAPQFSTLYEQQKNNYTNTQDIQNARNDFTKARESVDFLRDQIDNLTTSINQQFGGSGLTQAQRDAARERQNQALSSQFTQYNASYQTKFADYNKMVDQAFSTSMDVANKNYDSYWDGVRQKFSTWTQQIENEKQWSSLVNKSESQLFSVEQEYRNYQFQQKLMQQQREFETWLHNFKMQQLNSSISLQKQAADSRVQMENKMREDKAYNQQLIRDFQANRISWSQVESQYRK